METWTDITPPTRRINLWYGYCAVGVDAQRNGTVMVGTWNRWWPGDDFFAAPTAARPGEACQQYSVRDTSLSVF